MLDSGEIGNPLWQVYRQRAMPAVKGDIRADVVVVGGGLTGLSTAWHLGRADSGLKAILVEASQIGGGASGRAAGNCLDLVGENVEQLVAQFGRSGAIRGLQYGQEALAYVKSQAKRLSIPYTAPEAELIEVAVSPPQIRVLERRLALLCELGFDAGRTWLDGPECRNRFPAGTFLGAISSRHARLSNPRLLVERWRDLALETNVQIFEQSPVARIERLDTGFKIVTPQSSIVAERVVIATNAFTDGTLDGVMTRVQRPVWTYCIATDVIQSSIWGELGLDTKMSFYDANHLLHYFRRTDDGRLLFGGGQPGLEPSTHASLETHAAELELQLGRYFPSLAGVRRTAAWCGPISVTRDLSPALCSFHEGRMLLAVGCIGHGLVSAQYNGKLLADALLGNGESLKQFPFRRPKRWPGLGLDGVALRAMRSFFRAKDSWNASA